MSPIESLIYLIGAAALLVQLAAAPAAVGRATSGDAYGAVKTGQA